MTRRRILRPTPPDPNPHPPCGEFRSRRVVWHPLGLRERAHCPPDAEWQRNLDNHEATRREVVAPVHFRTGAD
jgi:hypothetical protein